MTVRDIDTRGREAGRAALDAVAPLVEPAVRRPLAGRAVVPVRTRIALAAVTLLVAVGLTAIAVGRPSPTTVSSGPASQAPPTTLPPPPPPGVIPSPRPFSPPIASGGASDGNRWSLFIGGPSDDLCLEVQLPDTQARGPTVCAGAPFGAPASDRYRPLLQKAVRVAATVAGRMPAGVVSVVVEQADGGTVGPVPVIDADGGPYYVVEVPGAPPVAVEGRRADGTAVRRPVA